MFSAASNGARVGVGIDTTTSEGDGSAVEIFGDAVGSAVENAIGIGSVGTIDSIGDGVGAVAQAERKMLQKRKIFFIV